MPPQRVLSEPTKSSQLNERPPLRVQRSTQSLSTDLQKDKDIEPERPSTSATRGSIKVEKEKSLEGGTQTSTVASISIGEIKALLSDPLWTKR